MAPSAEQILKAVEADLPEEAIGREALEDCSSVASRLPSGVRSYYLECRLDDDPQVDFLVQFTDRLQACRDLQAVLPASPSRSWEQNVSLFRRWSDDATPLREVPFLWLEYDIDADFDSVIPEASPSIGVERGYFSRYRERPDSDNAGALRRASAGLAALASPAPSDVLQATVDRCVRALPARGALIYVSWMITRTPSCLKLYLALPKTEVLAYLARIGWRGDEERVRRVIETQYGPVQETAFIDVSVDDRVLSRVGFALSQLHRREMERFTEQWACVDVPPECTRKMAAVRRWPGIAEMRLDGQRSWLHRWLDLKFILEENGRLRPKAYLGFMPRPPLPFA
ncbi:MAG TPA: hypothetical protein VMT03_05780 [Polyangia bacterium]|nr:hypothetical protein [Polyangia bacterium]